MTDLTEGQVVTRNYNFLLNEQVEMTSFWMAISDLIRPVRLTRRGLGGSGGRDKRYDSTASNSSRIITFAMQAGSIPKSLVWLLYRIPPSDPAAQLNQNQRVSAWLQQFSSVVWLILNRSNFHRTAGETYWDGTTFHTAAGYSEENLFARGFQNLSFKSLPIGAYVFGEDKYGLADSMYEPFQLTAKQAEQEYALSQELPPETLPKSIQEALKNKKWDENFEFIRYVAPREGRNPESRFAKDMPFKSLDIFMGKKDRRIRTQPFKPSSTDIEVVRESGYHEFPYWVWRWSTQPGEIWGSGMSDIALPSIRLINRTREKLAKAMDQAVDPAYWVNPDLLIGKPRFNSGMINYTRDVAGVAKANQYEGRWDWGKVDVDGLRQEIKDIYFSDFMVLPGKNMTAEEVITLRTQLDRVLGPNMDSAEFEFLTRVVERAAATAIRSGIAPPAPPELEAVQSIEPQFLGTLARAQQLNDVQSVGQFMNLTNTMMERFPEAGDNVDIDEVVKIVGTRLGIPDKILRDVDAVDAIRAAKREVVEEQLASEQAVQVTKAISQGADAEKALSEAGQVG